MGNEQQGGDDWQRRGLADDLAHYFGRRRARRLMGWVAMYGAEAVIEHTDEFRALLGRQGVSRKAAFCAALDLCRFREWVEERERVPLPAAWLAARLAWREGKSQEPGGPETG